MKIDYEKLIKTALDAREKAYVPYSSFRVGAALLTKDGHIYSGCNIENAAYTPSNCAERTAFFKAVSEGDRDFCAIAISAKNQKGEDCMAYPCGVCRQVMMEFTDAKTFLIIIAKNISEYKEYTLEQLLPFGFGPNDLK